MATESTPPIPQPPAGWYPNPQGPGQRWWDGVQWGPVAPPAPPTPYYHPGTVVVSPAEKSSAIAVILTILWPGAGHLYLGLTRKGTPHVVANAIGFACALTGVLFFIGILIWLVTLFMTVGGISRDTESVNQAIREGRRVEG